MNLVAYLVPICLLFFFSATTLLSLIFFPCLCSQRHQSPSLFLIHFQSIAFIFNCQYFCLLSLEWAELCSHLTLETWTDIPANDTYCTYNRKRDERWKDRKETAVLLLGWACKGEGEIIRRTRLFASERETRVLVDESRTWLLSFPTTTPPYPSIFSSSFTSGKCVKPRNQ